MILAHLLIWSRRALNVGAILFLIYLASGS